VWISNAYADALFERYSNTAIRHRTWQIAMDGSQKLPQRILGTISDNLSAGRESPGLVLAVAGWMRYVGGIDEKGEPIEVKDPLAVARALRCGSDGGPESRCAAWLPRCFQCAPRRGPGWTRNPRL
jgi:fructuronate reductase